MNDIVSIRKIRPLPSAEVGTGGAALTCGGDFFLAGNWPSLTAEEFLASGNTEAHRGKRDRFPVFLQAVRWDIFKGIF
jgi:hypothetical protein